MLCNRTSEENEASRRMKTEFLVQLDGTNTNNKAQVIIIGATNRPDELDDAARRRFVKRIYVPLPDKEARKQMIHNLLGLPNQKQNNNNKIYHILNDNDINELVIKTAGYSGADIRALCTEAAMGPVREISTKYHNNLQQISVNEFPPIVYDPHILQALDAVSATVSSTDLQKYIEWNEIYGTYRKLQIESEKI